MPSPNPTTRREYAGNAAATTLSASMTNVATTFAVTDATNWPTGGTGKFIVTIDRGQATEERVLCLSRSGTTITVDTRGFDSTTAQAHSSTAPVECTLSAFDADEWNAHTNATAAVHGAAGTIVGTSDSQTLTNKTMSGAANTFSNIPQSASHTSPDTDSATSALHHTLGTGANQASAGNHTHTNPTDITDTGWANYTPVWTGATANPANNATIQGRYKQIGKTVHVEIYLTAGNTGGFGTGNWSLSLPVTADATAVGGGTNRGHHLGYGFDDSAAAFYICRILIPTSAPGTVMLGNCNPPGSTGGTANAIWDAATPFAWANSDYLRLAFTYEAD